MEMRMCRSRRRALFAFAVAGIAATTTSAQEKPVEWRATCLCESGVDPNSVTAIVEINDENREAYRKQIVAGGAELNATVVLSGGACKFERGCGKTSSRRPKGDGTFVNESFDNKEVQGSFKIRIMGTGDIPRATVDGKRVLDEARWKTAKVVTIFGKKQP